MIIGKKRSIIIQLLTQLTKNRILNWKLIPFLNEVGFCFETEYCGIGLSINHRIKINIEGISVEQITIECNKACPDLYEQDFAETWFIVSSNDESDLFSEAKHLVTYMYQYNTNNKLKKISEFEDDDLINVLQHMCKMNNIEGENNER